MIRTLEKFLWVLKLKIFSFTIEGDHIDGKVSRVDIELFKDLWIENVIGNQAFHIHSLIYHHDQSLIEAVSEAHVI